MVPSPVSLPLPCSPIIKSVEPRLNYGEGKGRLVMTITLSKIYDEDGVLSHCAVAS